MKKCKLFLLTVFVFILFSAIISCKHEIQLTEAQIQITGGTQTCSADTVYFQNKVLPLLNSGCAMSGCHDAITHKEGVNLTTYAKIFSTGGVLPGNPANSKLYKVIIKSGSDRMPPAPAPAFTQAQKDIIYNWILQGAKNNACNDCDTAVITYSGATAPIVNTYCKGCHNPSSLGGGIDLSTYAGIKTIAANGKLMGSITHASGFIAMPQGGSKLSDCRIQQIQKWIAAGALNN
ncbi:c-type cytochrome domain-containing protein [Ferruginibacter profundus]